MNDIAFGSFSGFLFAIRHLWSGVHIVDRSGNFDHAVISWIGSSAGVERGYVKGDAFK